MRCALTCLTWFHEDARELYKIQSLVVLFFWTEKTFCKNIRGRGDSPTDTQASRAVANRIFILSVLNELNGAPTLKLYIIRTTRASLRIDSNYLDFRPFYANWTKEITWCFPGDYNETINHVNRTQINTVFRSTQDCESRILSVVSVYSILFPFNCELLIILRQVCIWNLLGWLWHFPNILIGIKTC